MVIIDAAPTGEALRLLSFPEMARWYMHRIFPLEKMAAAAFRPLIKPFMKVPIPDQKIFSSVQFLYQQLDKVFRVLTDPEVSTIRLVVNPEKMVIKEAQRTFTYLNLYGYSTDLIVCNRLIGEDITDGFLAGWREQQRKHYKLIEEGFSPIPVLDVPFFDREVVGLEMLQKVAGTIFGDWDPTRVLYQGQRHRVTRDDGMWVMAVPLPFLSKAEVSLLRADTEVVVQAGPHRRSIMLPTSLIGLDIVEAKYQDSELRLKFAARERKTSTSKEGARDG